MDEARSSAMRLPFIFIIATTIMSTAITGCDQQRTDSSIVPESLRKEALQELRQNLRDQEKWEKVHAAEYLLWLGYPEGVKEEYGKEEAKYGNDAPYRIGIWRVLAQCAGNAEGRRTYVDKILAAFKDREGSDRLHAAETLVKLKVDLQREAPEASSEILRGEKNALFMYTLAGAAMGDDTASREHFRQLLALTTTGNNAQLQTQGAYALRHLGVPSVEDWRKLADKALDEPADSSAKTYLVSSAWVTAPDDVSSKAEISSALRSALLQAKESPVKGFRTEMAVALGERGSGDDVPVLTALLHNEHPLNSGKLTSREAILATPENADVRSAAAYAILKLAR